ncbi:zinc finger MYM-type protein 1 [Trichonephila clavipes]|nr:zinc finger MYM-type protein 1 [Trichonephila clavipes]
MEKHANINDENMQELDNQQPSEKDTVQPEGISYDPTEKWELLNRDIKLKFTLKSLRQTRWSCHYDAVEVFEDNYGNIMDIFFRHLVTIKINPQKKLCMGQKRDTLIGALDKLIFDLNRRSQEYAEYSKKFKFSMDLQDQSKDSIDLESARAIIDYYSDDVDQHLVNDVYF